VGSWVEVLGLAGGALGLSFAVPQLVRVLRAGTAGVSAATWVLLSVVNAGWSIYVLRVHSPSTAVMSALGAVLYGSVVVALLARERADRPTARPRRRATVTGCTLVALPAAALVPAPVLGAALLASSVTRIPQVLASYRSFRAGRVTAVSRTAWVLETGSSRLWLAYGICFGDVFRAASPALNLIAATTIVALEAAASRACRRAA
jgi:uncharacterized protein with PQ loop repeat